MDETKIYRILHGTIFVTQKSWGISAFIRPVNKKQYSKRTVEH
jgi:hypothetical protein